MIQTLHIYPKIDAKLIDLLKGLSEDDWNRKTIVPLWNIKDIASHLLDGTMRGISISRDKYFGTKGPESNTYESLVAFLNRLNAEWIEVSKRISPDLLISLLETVCPLYHKHLSELDPNADSIFSVAWAGEELSRNWFHIAREYTEKYHHQQQIRLALQKDKELLEEDLYLPYLDTSMQALIYHYRNVEAKNDTSLSFEVEGINKKWILLYKNAFWIWGDIHAGAQTEVIIDPQIAWRIFSKGISIEEARSGLSIRGNQFLGEKILGMIAVMA